MSATHGADRHSRSTSKTDITDLEKGEARSEEEEEIVEEKVSLLDLCVQTRLTICRSHSKLKMKSAQTLRSICQGRAQERTN
jgi:hypothetical protein